MCILLFLLLCLLYFHLSELPSVLPLLLVQTKSMLSLCCVNETTFTAGKVVLLVSKRFVWPYILIWRVVWHQGGQTKESLL